MSRRKKGLLAGLGALCALGLAVGLYALAFPIRADNSNLAAYTDSFLSHGSGAGAPNRIVLYDSVQIGSQKRVLAEIDEQLGEIRLVRGINGRYRIDSVSYGDGNFREEIVTAGGRKYLVFGGRNAFFGIQEMTLRLEGREYSVDIPERDRFLVSVEVDPNLERNHIDLDGLRFYDGGGVDITQRVPW